ncbi:MAG TPA: lysophospholipid acyltransferase family protein [Polyangiaceae bacterium]|nr:lysophospholipid acyltransferase family protein [Polyangiaceae bacterium]
MALPSYPLLGRVALATLAISVPTVLDGVRGVVSARTCDARLDRWSRRLLRQAGVTLDVRGKERIDPAKTYVIMSNHQSYYDIPVLFQALGLPVRMVAKEELFRIPVWRRAMRDAGFIPVDRSKGREALNRLFEARKRLEQDGTHLWIAPEGTRSPDGRLLPFKRGGFQLASVTGLPILPVSIDGSIEIHRRGSHYIHRGVTVRVTVGEAVDPGAFGRKRMDELMEVVRSAIARPLGQDAAGTVGGAEPARPGEAPVPAAAGAGPCGRPEDAPGVA